MKEIPNSVEVSTYLNDKFRTGASVLDELNLVQGLERPIAIDFNNVLVNSDGSIANPEAVIRLPKLLNVGTVFIVTNAQTWERVHNRLKEYNLWNDRMILMVNGNWNVMTRYDSTYRNSDYRVFTLHSDLRVKGLLEKYINEQKGLGRNLTTRNFVGGAPVAKRIAPIFGKRYLVPLLDDSNYTRDNPGMLSIIVVKVFESDPGLYYDNGGVTFGEAVDIVHKHYNG